MSVLQQQSHSNVQAVLLCVCKSPAHNGITSALHIIPQSRRGETGQAGGEDGEGEMGDDKGKGESSFNEL